MSWAAVEEQGQSNTGLRTGTYLDRCQDICYAIHGLPFVLNDIQA